MIRRGEGGGAARGAAFIAFMVARVAYFSFQDGELVGKLTEGWTDFALKGGNLH